MTREKAIEWMEVKRSTVIEVPDRPQGARELIQAYDMAIEALQAEPKHGKWIKADRKTANGVDFLVLSCSECDNADPQMNYYNFCPNCGAKMDKE